MKSIRGSALFPVGKGKLRKKSLSLVTPVETRVRSVIQAPRKLDSGFRRNDGKKTQPDFFSPSG